MQTKNEKRNTVRPPVVVVMGHIDHGKSTLLDYIRQTNIVEKETGGITQIVSAYEVIHKNEHGKDAKITFIDTPGHEAFSKMRERGAKIADIAILVVSSEDGVKPQTIEAWKTIEENKIPYIVAINKIDKINANVEKTKTELAENEIYLENYGGKVPFVEISAKTGVGIPNLLSLILILSEMEEYTGNTEENASGFVIEANLDSKRGIKATLIIKNGTLKKGMTVIVNDAICSTRILENFLGKTINEAVFSSPVQLVGFNQIPQIGASFQSFENKKEAEKYIENWQNNLKIEKPHNDSKTGNNKKIIPIILKADVGGSIEAIEKEIEKINSTLDDTIIKNAEFKIIQSGTGPIGESDLKNISSAENTIVIGFNVKTEKNASELALKRGIIINNFDIIYKMTEWLALEMEKRRPKVESVETIGKAKIIKAFSRTKERQIIGGKVLEGNITLGNTVKIMRRDFEIGRGKIVNLEKGKVKTNIIEEGVEFGMMLESKIEVVNGDVLESFATVQK